MPNEFMRIILAIILLWFIAVAQAANLKPLPPDEAFVFTSYFDKNNQLIVYWQIAPGYYLYRDQLKFKVAASEKKIKLGNPILPPGHVKQDSFRGVYQVYSDELKISVPLMLSPPSLEGENFKLDVGYQGCSTKGFCYSPITKTLQINLLAHQVSFVSTRAPTTSYSTDTEKIFTQHGFFLTVLIFLGLGLLLAFTPCVLPIIPILSSIIVSHGKHINTRKAFMLSLGYVLGMAITYALAGIIVAWVGQNIQAQFQKPIVIISFSILFVLLALSLFGFYDLQLPARWRKRFNAWSHKQKGGTYIGVFVMGSLSSLIVSPCVSAPLVGVLAYIGETGDIWLGGFALLALGFGMGIPLLLIGASAGKLLPKAGPWMNVVKKIFGVLMLIMAVWLLMRVVPSAVINTSPFFTVKTEKQLDQQFALAKQNKQGLMLDFYADWCESCVRMERNVLRQPAVQHVLKKIRIVRADVTKNNAFDQVLLKKFNVVAPPTFLFFNHEGKELTAQRIIGEINENEFLSHLTYLEEHESGSN